MATSYTFQPPYVADVKLEVGTWNVPKSRHKCLDGLLVFLIQLFQSIKQGKWTPRKKKKFWEIGKWSTQNNWARSLFSGKQAGGRGVSGWGCAGQLKLKIPFMSTKLCWNILICG